MGFGLETVDVLVMVVMELLFIVLAHHQITNINKIIMITIQYIFVFDITNFILCRPLYIDYTVTADNDISLMGIGCVG